jgi:hypothetical protein
LDEATLIDYPFDLAKRYEFYKRVTSGPNAQYNLKPKGSSFLPQLTYFNQILESQQYGILDFVQTTKSASESDETLYRKGLEILKALNPGRIYMLNINLNAEFARWKTEMVQKANGDTKKILADPKNVAVAINTLVFGRVNLVTKPSTEIMEKLAKTLELAVSNASDEQFIPAAVALFKTASGTKYQIKVLNSNGQFQSPIQCHGTSCTLSYPEFTAIYPTGSMEAWISDEHGNRITQFATPGLWQFLNYGGKEFDNIRKEPYYGYAPKMDYEGIGNGFHNPAVRFWEPSKALKTALGLPAKHNTLWAPKRGGISHGCLRLALGHLWEMRQIFPVENSKATQIKMFGNNSQDFDVYDIDGDGRLEVMGVEYKITYGLKGADGLARREGNGFDVNGGATLEFYNKLYGAKNVFEVVGENRYVFVNPKVSIHSHLDFKKKVVGTRIAMAGRYPLFEQTYEREKVQFYSLAGGMTDANKIVTRLMGRVRGCAPTSDKTACGETAFDKEAARLAR